MLGLGGKVRTVRVDGQQGAQHKRPVPDRRADVAGQLPALARGRGRGLTLAVAAGGRARWRERLAGLCLGLESRLGDRMGLLSGGQRQAVALLMATMAPSKILLLDEHTAALDPRTAEFVVELTARLVGELRLTTLMVTHSMHQALGLGDRLLMLHEGRVCLDVAGEGHQGRQKEAEF